MEGVHFLSDDPLVEPLFLTARAEGSLAGSVAGQRRIAAALPAKVTMTAMARITGKSTGSMEICELKMERPI